MDTRSLDYNSRTLGGCFAPEMENQMQKKDVKIEIRVHL